MQSETPSLAAVCDLNDAFVGGTGIGKEREKIPVSAVNMRSSYVSFVLW